MLCYACLLPWETCTLPYKSYVLHLFRRSACESCGTSSKAYHDKFNHRAPCFVEPDGWKVHTQEWNQNLVTVSHGAPSLSGVCYLQWSPYYVALLSRQPILGEEWSILPHEISFPILRLVGVRFKQASVFWVLQMDSSLTHCKEAPTRSESPRLSPLLKR